ncbi:hypothetical protein GQ457_08G031780 [Hibiscus cannabinus]
MKSILPHCISNTQVAFVQGRAITDNILVAHDIVHTLYTSVSRSSQGVVFKLDMEKAFDRVEWPFLKAVMLRLGFAPSWVDLIMRCVSSVSSRVRVRGLSAALTAAQHEGRLPGVRASKHGPPVNHLLFVDDSLVFLCNNMSEVHCLKDILSAYSIVSGQKVNFSKSTAYFSPRTPSAHRIDVHKTLGVQEIDDPDIYLGVPLLIGKNKYAAFGRYRDKVDTRVSKWSNLLLSFSGREVLIKSVAQALRQYVMSYYMLPCSLVEEMSRSIRRFWWSGKGSARAWPLVAWDDIYLPKTAGRIGFKDLHLFNIALLGKQIWRLLSAPGSLLYRTLRAKYFPDGDLLSTEEIPLRCREFMVPGQARWDRTKLMAHLSPGDVESILEVPISPDRADTLVWGDHDSGLYTVRSGYLFLRRPPSPIGPPLCLWKILAKLPTIPKVRSFGWRCGREALPVGSRLRDAGLSAGACPLCGAGLEDVLHLLRDCSDSSAALRQAGFADSLLSVDWATSFDWLRFAASSISLRSFALFLSILWGLWRRCNTWVHERSLYPLHLVVEDAALLCHDYALASAPSQVPPRAAADPPPAAADPPRWRPPPAGSVKINVDGAFLPSVRLGAIGVIARDSSSAVLGGFAKPVPVHGPASTLEVSALFAGLEFAIANDWPSALIESDAAVLVNKLHRPTVDLSLLGDLLAPSRALLAASNGRLRVGFASRSANTAAHALASWACHNDNVI